MIKATPAAMQQDLTYLFEPDVLAPRIVPKIVRGEAFFCIGMSEPDSGSDLASIRTKATKTEKGWLINGRKVWTSGAHRTHYMIALVRTSERSEDRHAGMSQFLIDMKTPGMTVRPIISQIGEHDFNEVTFDDVLVPHENLIGTEGGGWKQVVTELAFERSGPERYLSSTQLLLEMLDAANANDPRHAVALGRIAAQYATLRQMSLGVSGMLARDIRRCPPWNAQYTTWLDDRGFVLEDGVIQHRDADEFLLTSAEPNFAWFAELLRFDALFLLTAAGSNGASAAPSAVIRRLLLTELMVTE